MISKAWDEVKQVIRVRGAAAPRVFSTRVTCFPNEDFVLPKMFQISFAAVFKPSKVFMVELHF